MKSRFTCPGCRKSKEFARYINVETKEYVDDAIGRCNREVSCGYHQKPKQFFEKNGSDLNLHEAYFPKIFSKSPPRIASYIPANILISSLRRLNENFFINYLQSIFDHDTTLTLIETYYLGSSKHWPGATVFWQIDRKDKIRTGKVMLYDPENGKRIKQPHNHITWVHNILKLPDFNLRQCLFGEHLLNDNINKPVAITESEKAALISSIYFPEVSSYPFIFIPRHCRIDFIIFNL